MQSKNPLEFSRLQDICQAVVKIKKHLTGQMPHDGHDSLYFCNDEITTGLLNNKIQIKIHLGAGKMAYHDGQNGAHIDIIHEDISEKLAQIIADDTIPEIPKLENPVQEDMDTYRFFAAQSVKILGIFETGLENGFAPVRLWPHHFDFSVEWYAGKDGGQIKTGISPGDQKYPMPYLYVNPWPFNQEMLGHELPLGRWHTDGWNGIKVEWSEIVRFHPDEAALNVKNLFDIARQNFDHPNL